MKATRISLVLLAAAFGSGCRNPGGGGYSMAPIGFSAWAAAVNAREIAEEREKPRENLISATRGLERGEDTPGGAIVSQAAASREFEGVLEDIARLEPVSFDNPSPEPVLATRAVRDSGGSWAPVWLVNLTRVFRRVKDPNAPGLNGKQKIRLGAGWILDGIVGSYLVSEANDEFDDRKNEGKRDAAGDAAAAGRATGGGGGDAFSFGNVGGDVTIINGSRVEVAE